MKPYSFYCFFTNVIKTTIVSPIARPTPKIIAVNTPDLAAGNTTRMIVSHLFAPSANEASRKTFGTEFHKILKPFYDILPKFITERRMPFYVGEVILFASIQK